MVYATKIIKDLGLTSDEWSLLLTFTVMEEDCDGLCWQYIVQEEKIRPECVVVTDSTNCKVLRGQRGRMEIGVTVLGRSCHGSMPEKGDNAVYKAAKIVGEIEKLHKRLKKNKFLGNGTVTVSYIDCQTPSRCAVPGAAFIQLDRRLTVGETKEQALKEVREAVKRAGVEAKVELLKYAEKAYTGLTYPTDKYFPSWCEEEDAPQVRAAVDAHKELVRQAADCGSLDVQHERRFDCRHVRHSVRRLRAGGGRCGAHGERQRADRAFGALRRGVCGVSGNVCGIAGEGSQGGERCVRVRRGSRRGKNGKAAMNGRAHKASANGRAMKASMNGKAAANGKAKGCQVEKSCCDEENETWRQTACAGDGLVLTVSNNLSLGSLIMPDLANLLADIPTVLPEELVDVLVRAPRVQMVRVVSRGQCSPPGFWYDQARE